MVHILIPRLVIDLCCNIVLHDVTSELSYLLWIVSLFRVTLIHTLFNVYGYASIEFLIYRLQIHFFRLLWAYNNWSCLTSGIPFVSCSFFENFLLLAMITPIKDQSFLTFIWKVLSDSHDLIILFIFALLFLLCDMRRRGFEVKLEIAG